MQVKVYIRLNWRRTGNRLSSGNPNALLFLTRNIEYLVPTTKPKGLTVLVSTGLFL